MININVATQFSKYPAGRFLTDGPYSGELFRQKMLEPALSEQEDVITIELDGARGYGSSFLEEAFGGLIRKGYSADKLLNTFKFITTKDPSLEEEIKQYIIEEANRSNGNH